MLSAILNLNQNHQSSRLLDSSAVSSITCSTQSAFSKWTCRSDDLYHVPTGTASMSQCLLKSILHTIPFLHTKHHRDHNPSKSCDGQCQNAGPDSLNDKFIILRSVVPFATKMDNTSILGETVEYLEQLRQKIQDLEAQNREFQSSRRTSFQELHRNAAAPRTCRDKRKLRILEGVGDGCTRPKVLKSPSPITSLDTNLQVSIIGSDGLLELQCPYKEGLLLDILLILHGLRIETTAVRSSVSNGLFIAELHAKVYIVSCNITCSTNASYYTTKGYSRSYTFSGNNFPKIVMICCSMIRWRRIRMGRKQAFWRWRAQYNKSYPALILEHRKTRKIMNMGIQKIMGVKTSLCFAVIWGLKLCTCEPSVLNRCCTKIKCEIVKLRSARRNAHL